MKFNALANGRQDRAALRAKSNGRLLALYLVLFILLAQLIGACGGGNNASTETPVENDAGGRAASENEQSQAAELPSSIASPEALPPVDSEAGSIPEANQALGGTIPPPSASVAELEETVKRLFQDSLAFPLSGDDGTGIGIDGIEILRAAVPAEAGNFWLAHTTGMRDFTGNQFHRVNIYRQMSEHVVAEVARINLSEEALGSDAVGIPDYLGAGSVHQTQIEPSALWFAVEGGIGAHAGVYDLLRYDPANNRLEVMLATSHESPGVASEVDLDGDGFNEVLVDATDPYVFCYACGVRLPQLAIWRWDGTELAKVELTPLQSGSAGEDINAQLLALAQAGLWQDVIELLPTAAAVADAEPDGTLAWNIRLLRENGEAKQAASENADAPYPLLSHLFYGDYAAAGALLRAVSPDELFATPSALVQQTVAESWEETLASWIERTTAPALMLAPDNVNGWLVRAWGDWLIGDIEDARSELERGLEFAPDDNFLLASAELLGGSGSVGGAQLVALSPVEIRSGPGNTFPILSTLQPGQAITITGRLGSESDLWWQVPAPGPADLAANGWVRDDVVRSRVDAATRVPEVLAPAQVAPVAPQGRILYSQVQSNGLSAILEVDVALSATPEMILEDARQPALRPQGNVMAFSSERPDMLGLGSIDLRTGERSRYTFNLEDALPRWNSAGDALIFSSTREGDRRPRVYQTFAAGATTAESLRLGQDADWSRVDERIIFKGCDNGGNSCGLWLMAEDGTAAAGLTQDASDARPRWSPDGTSAVFMSSDRHGNWEIYLLQVADGTITRLTDAPGEDGLPTFSPDGSSIAWVRHDEAGWGIYTQMLVSGVPMLVHDLGIDYPDWLDQGLDWAP